MTRCPSSRAVGSCPASASSRSRPSSTELTCQPLADQLRTAGATESEPIPKVVRALGSRATAPSEIAPKTIAADGRLADVVAASIADALMRIVRHDPQARLGQPEGVHQIRVAMRRLRSDLRTLGDAVDPHWREEIEPRLRAVADAAADARDADVMSRAHAGRARRHHHCARTAVRDPRAAAHRRARAPDGDARRGGVRGAVERPRGGDRHAASRTGRRPGRRAPSARSFSAPGIGSSGAPTSSSPTARSMTSIARGSPSSARGTPPSSPLDRSRARRPREPLASVSAWPRSRTCSATSRTPRSRRD